MELFTTFITLALGVIFILTLYEINKIKKTKFDGSLIINYYGEKPMTALGLEKTIGELNDGDCLFIQVKVLK